MGLPGRVGYALFWLLPLRRCPLRTNAGALSGLQDRIIVLAGTCQPFGHLPHRRRGCGAGLEDVAVRPFGDPASALARAAGTERLPPRWC